MDKQQYQNRIDNQSPLHRNKLDSYVDKCYDKINDDSLYCDPFDKFEDNDFEDDVNEYVFGDNEEDDDKGDSFIKLLYGG